jgi:hypothetical protein
MMDDRLIDSRGGSASAYIAWWDEPQPSDQTDMKQWSRCVVEVGWRPPREGDPLGRGAKPADLTCGASQSHLAAAEPPLHSRAFWHLLCPSSATFRSVRVMSHVLGGLLPSQLLDKYLEKDYFAKLWNLIGLVPGLMMMIILGSSRVF